MFRLKNILILLGFTLLTTLLSQPSNFFYENIKEGQVSDKSIFSPKNVRYIDVESTNQIKQEKLLEVQDVYVKNDQVFEKISQDFNSFISSTILVKKQIESRQTEIDSMGKTKRDSFDMNAYKKEQIKTIKNPFEFKNDEIAMFLTLEESELVKINEVFSKELEKTFDARITEENLETVRKQFRNNTNFYYFFSKDITNTIVKKLSLSIVPNFILDVQETEKRKSDALSTVDDIYKVVQKGEMIVGVGDVVTKEQIRKLEEVGVLKQDFHFKEVLMQFPYFVLIFGMFYFYLFHFYKNQFSSFKIYVFMLSSMSFVVLCTSLIKDTFLSQIPLLTLLMVCLVFWGRKFIIFSSIVLGLLLDFGDFSSLALTVIAGLVLSVSFSRKGKRLNLIISGIIVGIVLALSDFIVYFSLEQSINIQSHLSYLISAFTASILTVGLIPLLENALSLVTAVRLYELSDPNHPLLKRLMKEALGTYTHSIMVGNLAEMAAEEIEANGLLLRVGAYFHDVGKLRSPEHFIENTTKEDNPHNLLDPKESVAIIRKHPLDSIQMCKEYKLPEPIINLIYSHHSDSVLEFFYNKAVKNGEEIVLDDFRYQTPTPKTKEEGILLLADSVEAFSRTLKNRPKNEVEPEIKRVIFEKVQRGDLRDCALTMKDLDAIIRIFTNYLVNSNHERISYKNDDLAKS